jgi:hypothetical protein
MAGPLKEATASGNVRFVAESNEAGHGDDFWAHALALHAAKPATGPITDPKAIRYGPNTSNLTPRRVFVPRRVLPNAAPARLYSLKSAGNHSFISTMGLKSDSFFKRSGNVSLCVEPRTNKHGKG